jgi:Ca-activated chloride channel family protein
VKIQLELNPKVVSRVSPRRLRESGRRRPGLPNDRVDGGEIGAGHQVTALYELTLTEGAEGELAVVHVRAKEPRGTVAKETEVRAPVSLIQRDFSRAPSDLRFATAVMGGAELLRQSPYARGWTYGRVISIISDTSPDRDADRAELLSLMKKAAWLAGETGAVTAR